MGTDYVMGKSTLVLSEEPSGRYRIYFLSKALKIELTFVDMIVA